MKIIDIEAVYDTLSRYDEHKSKEESIKIIAELTKLRKDLLQEEEEEKVHKLMEHREYFSNMSTLKTAREHLLKSKERFTLTANQKFLKQFMSKHTRNMSVLLFHGVGVGKTCTSITIAENFNWLPMMNKTLVIGQKLLRKNFYQEIVNESSPDSCVGDTYMTSKKGTKKKTEDRNRRNILQKYEFLGYIEFSNIISELKQKLSYEAYKNTIFRKFSNRVIIVDEVHNLRTSDSSKIKKIPGLFQDILTHAVNVRLVYLSATPVFDDPSEVIWLANTLCLNEKRAPLFKDGEQFKLFDNQKNLTKESKKLLHKFSKNHVSFMRGESPLTFPTRIYPSFNSDKSVYDLEKDHPTNDVYKTEIDDSEKIKHLELVKSNMGKEQYKAYVSIDYKTSEKENEFDEDSLNESSNVQKRIQVSNIFYPSADESTVRVGKKGLLEITNETTRNGLVSYEYKNQDTPRIFDPKVLKSYSPKMSKIMKSLNSATGIVIVYSKYIYSGLVPMACALESAGFTRYGGGDKGLLKNAIHESTAASTLKNNRGKTYTILSGQKDLTYPVNRNSIIDVVRSKENKNGEKIKVVLISSVATEGVDFKNVREIHILEPWYNLGKMEQIVGRGVRNRSHIDLDEKHRNVTIYHHVNSLPATQNRESIDFRMYRIAENKQKQISQIERVLKEGSVDCNLNKHMLFYDPSDFKSDVCSSQSTCKSNFAIGDIDYSKTCDYTKCEINCVDKVAEPTTNESSIVNRELLAEDIESMVRDIVSLYEKSEFLFYSFEQIEKLLKLPKDETHILSLALQRMLRDKTEVTFQDKKGRLVYNKNYYVFQSNSVEDQRIPLRSRFSANPLKKIQSLKISRVVKEIKTQNIQKTEASFTKTLNDSYNAVETNIQAFIDDKKSIKPMFVWGMVVDYLTTVEIEKLYNVLESIDESNTNILVEYDELIKSMKASGTFVFKDNKLIGYYASNEKERIKLFKGNTLTLNEQNQLITDLLKEINTSLDSKDVIYGFTNFSKSNSAPKFNTVEIQSTQGKVDKLKGAACQQTSQFSKELLTNYVENLATELKLKVNLGSIKKRDLCNLYEYLLRTQEIRFLRPVEVVIYKENLKKK